MLERTSVFGPRFRFSRCYASGMRSNLTLRTAARTTARAALLLILASCGAAPEVATSSLNLNGTYFGSGQVRAVKADGTEGWSGQLEVQIGVKDAPGQFLPEYQSVIWKGSDVTGRAGFASGDHSKHRIRLFNRGHQRLERLWRFGDECWKQQCHLHFFRVCHGVLVGVHVAKKVSHS
jgi:hypothetical protein